jgi:hypothetical protein
MRAWGPSSSGRPLWISSAAADGAISYCTPLDLALAARRHCSVGCLGPWRVACFCRSSPLRALSVTDIRSRAAPNAPSENPSPIRFPPPQLSASHPTSHPAHHNPQHMADGSDTVRLSASGRGSPLTYERQDGDRNCRSGAAGRRLTPGDGLELLGPTDDGASTFESVSRGGRLAQPSLKWVDFVQPAILLWRRSH